MATSSDEVVAAATEGLDSILSSISAVDDLRSSVGGLDAILGQLSASMSATAQAEKIAAATGNDLASVKQAMAAAARAQAQAEREAAQAMAQAQAQAAKDTETAAKAQAKALEEAQKAAKKAADEQAKAQADAASRAAAAQAESAQLVGQAMTAAQHPLQAMEQALQGLGPEGAAAAAGLQVLDSAVEASAGKLKEWAETAIEVTERATLLKASLEGLTGGAAAGAAAGKQIEGLVDALPFAKQQTQAWATSLLEVGEAGERLAAHVRAIAAAQALTAVTGGQGGAAAQQLFTRLAMGGKATESFMKQVHQGGKQAAKILSEMGLNIKDLGGELAVSKMNAEQFGDAVTNALQNRGGKALDAMAGSWAVISQKAHEGFLSLFSGLTGPVEEFMGSVKSLFGEFSKGGVAINVLKPIVTTVFSTLFKWAKMATDAVHKAFLYVVIGALTAYIALRPLINAVKQFAQSANFLMGLKAVLVLLAVPLGVLAAAFVFVGTVITGVIALVGAIGGAVLAATGAILSFVGSIVSAFTDAYNAATSAGGSIVDGLVAGVAAGAGRFVEALSGLASAGLNKFKSIFGIASPSKVMIEHGEENIAGGAAQGVERGADKFDESMERLGPKGGGKGAGRGGKTFAPTFSNCTFNGASQQDVWDWMDQWWEIQGAAGPEPEPAS